MYENQKDFLIIPVIRHTKVVWINSINPIASGWLVCINMMVEMAIAVSKAGLMISRGSLSKILILGISDKEVLFSWSFKRVNLNFGLQDQCFS